MYTVITILTERLPLVSATGPHGRILGFVVRLQTKAT
jgi:hypothetical protein